MIADAETSSHQEEVERGPQNCVEENCVKIADEDLVVEGKC